MRVFLAGASGAIGRRLVPLLVSTGHQVTATTTSATKIEQLTRLGADAVQLDLLDAAATRRAVADAKPDVIVHQATALADLGKSSRNLGKAFGPTNQLRTVGTQNRSTRRRTSALAVSSRRGSAPWGSPALHG